MIINRFSDCFDCPENFPIIVIDNDIFWTNKNGEKILLSDMSEQYIKNCLKFLNNKYYYWKYIFEFELNRRKNKMEE